MNKDQKNVPKLRFSGFTAEWEQRELSEMTISIDTGKSKFNANSSGIYEILGSTSVIGYDTSYDYEGDFLLTARVGANAGNLYRHSGKVKISDNTVFIKAEQIDFIYYLLDNYDLKKLSFGTGQPLIKASELKKLKIFVPICDKEKAKIADFITTVDSLITLNQRKLDAMKEYKKGMLQKMFPKEGETVPEVRFPGFSGKWKKVSITELLKDSPSAMKIGPFGSALKKEYYVPDGIKVYAQENVFTEDFELGNYYITSEKYQELKNCELKAGDLVISMMGTIGACAIFPNNAEKGIMNSHLLRIQFNNKVLPEFIKILLKDSPIIRKQIDRLSVGSIMSGLSSSVVKKLTFPITSVEEQMSIISFYESLDTLITLQQRKIDEMKEYKKGLLQQMFV